MPAFTYCFVLFFLLLFTIIICEVMAAVFQGRRLQVLSKSERGQTRPNPQQDSQNEKEQAEVTALAWSPGFNPWAGKIKELSSPPPPQTTAGFTTKAIIARVPALPTLPRPGLGHWDAARASRSTLELAASFREAQTGAAGCRGCRPARGTVHTAHPLQGAAGTQPRARDSVPEVLHLTWGCGHPLP